MEPVTARIELPYAVGGIKTSTSGRVIESAPIFRWMVGKTFDQVERWVEGQDGTIQILS